MIKIVLFITVMFVVAESATILHPTMRTQQPEYKPEIAIRKCVEYYVPVELDPIAKEGIVYRLQYESLCHTVRSDSNKDVEKKKELDDFARQNPCFKPNSPDCILVNTLKQARANEFELMKANQKIDSLKGTGLLSFLNRLF